MVHIIQSRAAKFGFKRFPATLLATLLTFALFAHAASCKMVPGGGIKKELIAACENGDLERVKEIIVEFPELVNCKVLNVEKHKSRFSKGISKIEETPLIIAIGNGHADIVKYLCENGADPNLKRRIHIQSTRFRNNKKTEFKSYESDTIGSAIYIGNLDIVKVLLAYGVDIHTPNDITGDPPIFIAASMIDFDDNRSELNIKLGSNYKGVFELLIAEGADINAKNNNGAGILHYCLLGSGRKTIEYLIQMGADYSSRDNNGYTPLGLAISKRRKEVADYLESVGAPT